MQMIISVLFISNFVTTYILCIVVEQGWTTYNDDGDDDNDDDAMHFITVSLNLHVCGIPALIEGTN